VTPTYTPVCGPPSLVDARIVASTCYGAANTVSYTNPGGFHTLMLVRIENSNNVAPTVVSFGGQVLGLVRSDLTYVNGSLCTYALVAPPSGSQSLVIDYAAANCNWNVAVEVYCGVDQSNPLGASSTSTGNSGSFTTNMTTTGPASTVSDYFALAQASHITESLGLGQVNLHYVPGCCEEVFGDEKAVGGAGVQSLRYTLSNPEQYTSQLLEIQGTSCGSPTPTSTPVPTIACTPVAPALVDARIVAQACHNAVNSIAYTNPGGAGTLMLLRIEHGSPNMAPTGVYYGGYALNLVRSDPSFSGGSLSTYELSAPLAGAQTLEIDYPAAGCSWNVAVEIYSGVDQAAPIGSSGYSQDASGSPPPSFQTTLATVRGNSVISDFMAINVLPPSIGLGAGQADLGYGAATGCCDNVFGDRVTEGPPGAYALTYNFSQGKQWSSQRVEIKGGTCPGVPGLRVAGGKGGSGLPEGKTLVLAPNPAHGRANVRLELPVPGALSLKVYGLDGHLALERAAGQRGAGIQEEQLDLATLASGIYLLEADVRNASGVHSIGLFKFAVLR
jgi:hypothetical protein